MSADDARYVRNLGRNMAIGLAVVFAVSVGLCRVGTGDLGSAAAIAGVPTLFAGPYLGLLITLISAVAPGREPVGAGGDGLSDVAGQ